MAALEPAREPVERDRGARDSAADVVDATAGDVQTRVGA
jgi:hypothetical protein